MVEELPNDRGWSSRRRCQAKNGRRIDADDNMSEFLQVRCQAALAATNIDRLLSRRG